MSESDSDSKSKSKRESESEEITFEDALKQLEEIRSITLSKGSRPVLGCRGSVTEGLTTLRCESSNW